MFPIGCRSLLDVFMFCVPLLLDFSKDIHLKNSLSPHSLASTTLWPKNRKWAVLFSPVFCFPVFLKDFFVPVFSPRRWKSLSIPLVSGECPAPKQNQPVIIRGSPPPAVCGEIQLTAVSGKHWVPSRACSGPGALSGACPVKPLYGLGRHAAAQFQGLGNLLIPYTIFM